MQNRTFLVLLRPILGEKMKTAPLPPPKKIGCGSCEVDVVIRPEKAFEYPLLAEKTVSISVKSFFLFFVLEITCFWAEKAFEFPILPEKSVSISVKTFSLFFFFFGDHLFLGWKSVWISEFSEKFRLNFRINRVILIQEQWKFWLRSFAVFSLLKKSPPPPFSNPGYALPLPLDLHACFLIFI